MTDFILGLMLMIGAAVLAVVALTALEALRDAWVWVRNQIRAHRRVREDRLTIEQIDRIYDRIHQRMQDHAAIEHGVKTNWQHRQRDESPYPRRSER